MSLLESLVIVSEKAANIARLCRQETHLFELLVEEKGSLESNPRFVQDFKTLADVLIQETVRNDIGKQFPEIRDFIKGEENSTFCNTLGESVCVQIQNDVSDTSKLLKIVLDGDERASELLAEEVHKDVTLDSVPVCLKLPEDGFLGCEELGIWIDPIDSTAEYINGKEVIDENGISVSGLRCVTVLIGAFNRNTGAPIIGIVNQPFHSTDIDKKWRGRCHWGMKNLEKGRYSPHCCSLSIEYSQVICLSTSEDEFIKEKLRAKGFILVEAAGAGYKILSVITGQADAYILSKSTTFKWDTCGPQAILQSLGGDVLKFDDALHSSYNSLEYYEVEDKDNNDKINKYCNFGGIIAFRDKNVCDKIVEALNI